MDYSKMSDFEINKAVAIINQARNGYYITPRDYCNSWADAGPIIEKFGIGLMPFKKSPAKAWPLSVGLLSNASVEHEKPLRAAMIVYLMMHDKGEE